MKVYFNPIVVLFNEIKKKSFQINDYFTQVFIKEKNEPNKLDLHKKKKLFIHQCFIFNE